MNSAQDDIMNNPTFLFLALSRLEFVTIPELILPLNGANSEPDEDRIRFGVQYYTFSSIVHFRHVLRGLVQVSDDANWASANILSRHLFEWAAHATFLKVKIPSLIHSEAWSKAWDILLRHNGGDLFMRRFGIKYNATRAQSQGIPEPYSIANILKVYASAQNQVDKIEDIQEDYSLLSELSHASAACLRQHIEYKQDRIVFSAANEDSSPLELASVSTIDWLLSIGKLLEVIHDLKVRPQINEVLKAIVQTTEQQ
jgi:hypothetical protein